jgi:hypothetical protein
VGLQLPRGVTHVRQLPVASPGLTWHLTYALSFLSDTAHTTPLFKSTPFVCHLQERNSPHDAPGTYEGETALHIAIVNRDVDMVKFLVQV